MYCYDALLRRTLVRSVILFSKLPAFLVVKSAGSLVYVQQQLFFFVFKFFKNNIFPSYFNAAAIVYLQSNKAFTLPDC